MVDLSKARAGDTVKFRCGGEAIITRIDIYETTSDINFKGEPGIKIYKNDGLVHMHYGSVFDITEVIPAPVRFNWADTKWGYAFSASDSNNIFIFVGRSPDNQNCGVFMVQDSGGELEEFEPLGLTRAPEHDVEVG